MKICEYVFLSIISFVVLFSVIYKKDNRYSIIHADRLCAFKLDKITGKVWFVNRDVQKELPAINLKTAEEFLDEPPDGDVFDRISPQK